MADIRNHRHHGLFGALVVEPPDVTPFRPGSRTDEGVVGYRGGVAHQRR